MPTGFAHIHRQQFVPLVEALLNSSEAASLFDAYREFDFGTRATRRGHALRETLVCAVGDCLNHDDYRIATGAAVVLRENTILCSRACDLDAIITNLTAQLDDNRVQPATQAALALAFFLSTRPDDGGLPQWDGSNPMTPTTVGNDLDQQRTIVAPVGPGYLHEVALEVTENAIDVLIENLDRPKSYRSANWTVANECAKAIGAIGYQRPQLVERAIPVLEDLLGEQDERQPWLLYALTSIGYSRPDLVSEELVANLETFANETGFNAGLELGAVTNIGYRKVGHAPSYLEKIGCDPDTDLGPVVEKLCRFMLGQYPSHPAEVTQTFVSIYQSRPEDLVELLAEELEAILDGSHRTPYFPNNFMLVLKELAGVDATRLEPLLADSTQFYQDHSRSHYWYDNALELHRRVAAEDEELLPDDLGDVVREFFQSEDRASVQRNGRAFLEEIGEWDEDLDTSPSADELLDMIIEDMDESELTEFDTLAEELSTEEDEKN